jgi:hypothetical protein
MAAKRFTDSYLDSLKPKASPYRVRDATDARGFGVQVSTGGTRTFFVSLSIDGRRRFIGLEQYRPARTVDGERRPSNLPEQRERARQLRELRDSGVDPVQWLKDQEREQRTVGSFDELLDAYVESLGDRPMARFAKTTFEKNIRGVCNMAKAARDVTAEELTDALAKMHERGAVSYANRTHDALSAAFNYGRRHDHDPSRQNKRVRFGLTVNPVSAIRSHRDKERPGERVLTPDEIRAYWRALNSLDGAHPTVAALLKLQLLTGQRIKQFRVMRRRELFLDSDLLVFSSGTMKSSSPELSRPHALPLVPVAVEVIKQQCALAGALEYTPELDASGRETEVSAARGDTYLFPAPRNPENPLAESITSSTITRLCDRHDLPRFRARDVRRTWKTQAGEIGITKAERDLVQAHGRNIDASSRHYDRSEQLDEKHAALSRWTDWLIATVEG